MNILEKIINAILEQLPLSSALSLLSAMALLVAFVCTVFMHHTTAVLQTVTLYILMVVTEDYNLLGCGTM
jgi:hypothetical protein